ncbi:MAG: multiheme c-type cytochrome [Limisphaerales bacterium]
MSDERADAGGLNWPLVAVAIVTIVGGWFLLSGKRSGAVRDPEGTTVVQEIVPAKEPVDAVPDYDPEHNRPKVTAQNGYVSSSECRECHEHNHQSWHDSYHRTMTQIPTKDTVFGDFADAEFKNNATGHAFRMACDGDNFRITMFPPDETDGSPISWPIALMTGSHHMQAYWVPGKMGRTLSLLPVMFLKEEKKWVPRTSVFLQPPAKHHGLEAGRWNEGCIRCHATAGESRWMDPLTYHDTTVAEFGISCESCHGPGGRHVELRKEFGAKLAADKDPIVNPINLSHERSSQVCGACHSRRFIRKGFDGTEYRPGKDLFRTHLVFRDEPEVLKEMESLLPSDGLAKNGEEEMRFSFWSDGNCRGSAGEFNAMIASSCFKEGEMSCFSCHQLHQAKRDIRPAKVWADDQLRDPQTKDTACLQCHEQSKFAASDHTHHVTGSSGSSCYNCHMPHTTYGLMKAIRSHTVTSPDVKNTVATTRPNACNLCHLDKTLAWTAGHLENWYGIKSPDLNEDQKKVAATVLDLLRGDAGLRALTAWNMGWEPATKISDSDWLVPYLGSLLDDEYDTVRYLAGKSLKRVPGYEDLEYDFVGTVEHQQTTGREVLKRWLTGNREAQADLLIAEDGKVKQAEFNRLLSQRDLRPLLLKE